MVRLGEDLLARTVTPTGGGVSERPERRGVFYPRGYVIVTFESTANAEEARRRLVDGGYDEEDVQLMDTEQVKKGTSEDLQQLGPVMRALGSEGDLIRDHQSQAAGGATFLL